MAAILSVQGLRIKFPTSDTEKQVVMSDFRAISIGGVMNDYIGCVDGWLCLIKSPLAKDTGDIVTGRYFNGHYFYPGINSQAVCDAHCRFIAVNASSPRSVNDVRAFRDSRISGALSSSKTGMYLIGDNSYPVSEHLLTPFSRNQILDEYQDSFNLHASQPRIRIVMSFGLSTTKWQIFRSPIERNLLSTTTTIYAAMTLYNTVINRAKHEEVDYSIYDESISPLRVSSKNGRINDVANLTGYMSSDISIEDGV